MREKDLERYLKERVTGIGGLCWKFTSPGTAGVPDRIVICNRQIVFVELKRPDGGQLSALQKRRLWQLSKLGHWAKVIRTAEEVDALIEGLEKGVYRHGRIIV